jgi:hypothetical protein
VAASMEVASTGAASTELVSTEAAFIELVSTAVGVAAASLGAVVGGDGEDRL